MDTITIIFIGIAALFFIILALKNIFNVKKICVICLSITLAWISLLTLYFLNIFIDKILIAILMGHTSLGLFYLWEKKVRKNYLVFRLPLLLTFIFIIYSILGTFSFNSIIFLIILWLLFFIFYILRTKKSISKFVNKIIECCKKW